MENVTIKREFDKSELETFFAQYLQKKYNMKVVHIEVNRHMSNQDKFLEFEAEGITHE